MPLNNKILLSFLGVRKGLLIQKVPTKKVEDLMVLQIHLAGLGYWFLRDRGHRDAGVLVGHVFTGGPWNLAFMIKGVSLRSSWMTNPWLLKGFRCSSSGYGLVLWFCVLGLVVRHWFWVCS